MLELLERLARDAEEAISRASSLSELAEAETHALGRKGTLTSLLRGLGALPPDARPAAGRRVNDAKARLEVLAAERRTALHRAELDARLQAERIDVTLPGRGPHAGRTHPLTRIMDEVRQVMVGLGFEFIDSPEIEEYRFNFEALNYPPDHPAMDEQMSFYLEDGILLRTQTTAAQGRVLPNRKPPLKIGVMGRCYRYEAVDATHGHTFQQVDGFMVDRGIGMQHLRGTLDAIARALFGPDVRIRFRPDFFPFVEPGAEIAVSCFLCKGSGCAVCKKSGWLELGGSGLIHPNILRGCGIDPEEWSGFAFGLGLERMPMLQRGIDDMRLFYENDLRFLEQF